MLLLIEALRLEIVEDVLPIVAVLTDTEDSFGRAETVFVVAGSAGSSGDIRGGVFGKIAESGRVIER